MLTIAELRKQYPEQTAGKTDFDIADDVAQASGVPTWQAAAQLGVSLPNDPGFFTSVKQGLGSFPQGIGQGLHDAGWKNNPVLMYGREVEQMNPSSEASQSWEGFKSNPLQGVREFTGQAVGSTLTSMIPFVGQGGRATSLLGRGLAAGRTLPAQTALAAVPVYGQVREEQDKQGFSDIPAALAASIGSGIVESKLGLQGQLMRNAAARPMAKEVAEFGATPWRTFGKTWVRSGLEEGAEELAQQPMQQLGAHQNPLTEASLRDTGWSGFGGLVGGAFLGPLGAMGARSRHAQITQQRAVDLTNLDVPFEQQQNAAQWEREFRNKDSAGAGDQWYNAFIPEQIDLRNQAADLVAADNLQRLRGQFAEDALPTVSAGTYGATLDGGTKKYGLQIPLNAPLGPVSFPQMEGVGSSDVSGYAALVPPEAPMGKFAGYFGETAKPAQPATVDPNREFKANKAHAIWTSALQQLGEGHEALEGINQYLSQGKYPKAQKLLDQAVQEKSVPAAPVQNPQQVVQEMLAKLSDDERAVLTAYNYEKRTFEDIAEQRKLEGAKGWGTKARAQQIHAKAKAKLVKLGARYGLTPEVVDQMFPNENNRLMGGADVQTYSAGEVAQMGANMHVPGAAADTAVADRGQELGAEGDLVGGFTDAGQFDEDSHLQRGPVELGEDGGIDAIGFDPTAKDHAGRPLRPVDYEDALGRWEELEGAALPRQFHTQWTKLYVSHADGVMNDARFAEQYAALSEEAASTGRSAGTSAEVERQPDGSSPARSESGAREADGRRSRDDTSFDGIIGEWNRLAKDRAVVDYAGLSKEQQGYLQGSGTWAEFDEAAREVLAEINDVPEPQYSEYDPLVPKYGVAPDYQGQVGRVAGRVEIRSPAVILANPKVSYNLHGYHNGGGRFQTFEIYDAQTRTKVGLVELEMDGNTPVALHDLAIRDEYRGGGYGAHTVGALLSLRPDATFKIVEIIKQSEGFWESVGAQKGYDGNADLNWHQFADARRDARAGQGNRGGVRAEQAGEAAEAGTSGQDVAGRHSEGQVRPGADQEVAKSETERSGNGSTAQEVAAKLKGYFFSPERFDKLVAVADTEQDLPEAARRDLSQAKGKVQGFVGTDGKVYLIASNIQPGKELSVFLHEVGVHLGMKKLIGEANLDKLTGQLEKWAADTRNKSLEAQLARAAVARAGYSSSHNRREEILAYFVEKAVDSGINPTAFRQMNSGLREWFQLLVTALRTALRKIGLGDFKALTAENIVDLAMGAAQQTLMEGAVQPHEVALSETALDPRVESAWASIKDTFAKYAPRFLTLHQLVEQYGDKLTSLKTYTDTMSTMEEMQGRLYKDAHALIPEWLKLSKATMGQLHSVMHRATLYGIHPDKEITDPANSHLDEFAKSKYDAVAASYAALPDHAKQVYQKALVVFQDLWQKRAEAFDTLVRGAYEPRIAEFRAAGKEEDAVALEKSRDEQIEKHKAQLKELKGPYFPLVRMGDYVVKVESTALADAREALEKASGEEHKELDAKVRKMERDDKHYVVEVYESRGEAEQAAKRHNLRKDIVPVAVKKGDQFRPEIMPLNAAGLEAMADKMYGEFDKATTAKLKASMTELYVSSLPENHALARQVRRKGIHGATPDMLRAFVETAEKDSFYISRLAHSDKLAAQLYDVKRQAKENSVELQHVFDDVASRATMDMRYEPRPVMNTIAKISSVFHLGMSPAYLLTNASQPWMITAPILSGRYGAAKTMTALVSAWRQAHEIIKTTRGGVFTLADADLTKIQNPEIRALLEYVSNLGQLDITVLNDAGMVATGTDPRFAKFQKAFNFASQTVEMSNRITTAIAAYELARDTGASEETAREAATKAVAETQLDYSDVNAAYVMKAGHLGGLNKLIMQFRKYQQGMLYLVVNESKKALKGDTAAMRSLGYLMMTQAAMAGAKGIPFITAALTVFGMFSGGDDEDGDLETKLRNYLADLLGKEAGEAVFKGLPTLLGTDLSKRVGLGDVWNPLPMLRVSDVEKAKTGKEAIGTVLTNVAGAPMGMAAQWLDAAGDFGRGDWGKGTEKMLPKMLADPLKATRYATEGMTSRKGETLLQPESFSASDIAQRALGFSSEKETSHYEAQNAYYNAKEAITTKRTGLMDAYFKARKSGEGIDTVMEKVQEFNEKHPAKEFRLTASDLAKSYQTRVKNSRFVDEAGVKMAKNDRALRDIDRFAR